MNNQRPDLGDPDNGRSEGGDRPAPSPGGPSLHKHDRADEPGQWPAAPGAGQQWSGDPNAGQQWPGVPGAGQPGQYAGAHVPGTVPPGGRQSQGSMQRQVPGQTQRRPSTVAEARARDKARQRADAVARAAAEAQAERQRTRNRVMIGGVAVVGVAALVGGGYLAYRAVAAPEVTAYCTRIDETGKDVVVPERECEDASQRSSGGGGMGGIMILNGMQYRYYYGGNNTVGKPPVGGSTMKPKGAEIKTKSGNVIQRGGLGSKSGGGS